MGRDQPTNDYSAPSNPSSQPSSGLSTPSNFSSRPRISRLTVRGDSPAETKIYHVYCRTKVLGALNNTSELVFKNAGEAIVYSTKQESIFLGGSRRHLYRGPAEKGHVVATIESPSKIYFQAVDGEIVLEIKVPGWFSNNRAFSMGGFDFKWEGFSKVTDGTGDKWAEVKMPWFGWGKLCDLTVTYLDEDMRDALVATFVARHLGYQRAQSNADYAASRAGI